MTQIVNIFFRGYKKGSTDLALKINIPSDIPFGRNVDIYADWLLTSRSRLHAPSKYKLNFLPGIASRGTFTL